MALQKLYRDWQHYFLLSSEFHQTCCVQKCARRRLPSFFEVYKFDNIKACLFIYIGLLMANLRAQFTSILTQSHIMTLRVLGCFKIQYQTYYLCNDIHLRRCSRSNVLNRLSFVISLLMSFTLQCKVCMCFNSFWFLFFSYTL